MAFEFRDVQLEAQEKDETFKRKTDVIPCVTCDASGVTADAGGNSISALVEEEPDRVWVKAYNDSIPFPVLNDNKIPPSTGILAYVGYLEDSSEREIIGFNNETLGITASTSQFSTYESTPGPVQRDNLASLKVTPGASGLTVSVTNMEYDRYSRRQVSFANLSFSIASLQPASGFELWVLVYLNARNGALAAVAGLPVALIGSLEPIKPNTPLDGYAAGYVRLTGVATSINLTDIEDARKIVDFNFIPGVVYNKSTSFTVPADYTMIRGNLILENDVGICIEDGGRLLII